VCGKIEKQKNNTKDGKTKKTTIKFGKKKKSTKKRRKKNRDEHNDMISTACLYTMHHVMKGPLHYNYYFFCDGVLCVIINNAICL